MQIRLIIILIWVEQDTFPVDFIELFFFPRLNLRL